MTRSLDVIEYVEQVRSCLQKEVGYHIRQSPSMFEALQMAHYDGLHGRQYTDDQAMSLYFFEIYSHMIFEYVCMYVCVCNVCMYCMYACMYVYMNTVYVRICIYYMHVLYM